MKISNLHKLKNKDLIVFDLDGTLTKTKSNLEPYMSDTLADLLKEKKVAIIGGGSYKQFRKQLISELKVPPTLLLNLFLFPTTANAFYRYKNKWQEIYNYKFPKDDWLKVKKVFEEVLKQIHYIPPKKIYGKVIENRGAQITFSALGQDVVDVLGLKGVRLKEKWKKENDPLKLKIARLVQKRLPEFEVHAAAFTSVDVTRKGVDKAYGLKQIQKHLKIPVSKMFFIGDAIFPGGNDYAVVKTGVDYMPVKGPKETEKIIHKILLDKI